MLELMKSDLEQIEDRARALSPEERAKLAESMLESLHEPLADVESAWAEEIERRVDAFDRGELPSYPAEDVFAEAPLAVRYARFVAPAGYEFLLHLQQRVST